MSRLNIIFLSLLIPIIGSSGTPNAITTTTNTFIFDEEIFQKLTHDVQHLKDVYEIMRLNLALNALSLKEEFAAVKNSISRVEEIKKSLLDRDLKLTDNFSKMIQLLETKVLSAVLVNVKSELADLRSSLKEEIGDMKTAIMSNVKSEVNKIQPQINSLSTSLQNEIGNLRNSLPISVNREIDHLRETIQPEINRITNISKSCETAVEVKFDKIKNTLLQTQESLAKLSARVKHIPKHYPSCVEALQNGEESGIYKLYLPSSGLEPFDVYCLRDPGNGPAWTVFQRRQDGSVDFYKNWQEYKIGFGDLTGDFFLGMEKLFALTKQEKTQQLWVKLSDWEGETRNARYTRFELGNEASKYNMTQLGDYSGDAGDALDNHRGQKFSTKDSDNDNSDGPSGCAVSFKGAWWFNSCYNSHLNGVYRHSNDKSIPGDAEKGIVWTKWRGLQYSLKYVHMALRPSN